MTSAGLESANTLQLTQTQNYDTSPDATNTDSNPGLIVAVCFAIARGIVDHDHPSNHDNLAEPDPKVCRTIESDLARAMEHITELENDRRRVCVGSSDYREKRSLTETAADDCTSPAPSTSPIPTPLPTVPGELRVSNATNYTELKTAVESAPPCGMGRLQVNLPQSGIEMGADETAIQLPASSCVVIVGGTEELPPHADARRLGPGSSYHRLVGNGHDRLFNAEGFVSEFQLRGLFLSNSHAADGSGGAVALLAGCGECAFVDCVLTNNDAAENGGAFYVQGTSTNGRITSVVVLDRTIFMANHANMLGGAVAISDGVSLRLKNVSFHNCTADVGGGIYIEHSEVDAHDVDFFNNRASSSGGGLAAEFDNTVRVRGGFASGNVARGMGAFDGGGAYYFYDENTIEITGVTADDNIGNLGGAVWIAEGSTAVISNVTARRNRGKYGGGAFAILTSSFAHVIEGVALANYAPQGGVFFIGYQSTVHVSGFSSLRNRAVDAGTFLILFQSNLFATGVVVRENAVSGWAGAAQIASGGQLILTHSLVSDCRADTFAGAFLAYQAEHLKLVNVTLANLTSAQASGGGIYVQEVIQVKMSRVTLSNCVSEDRGGGAFILDADLEISDSTFENSVGEIGGGLWYFGG